jgi:hypothetical protein
VGFHPQPITQATGPAFADPSSFIQRLFANDESLTLVPEEVWRAYLAMNQTNAESLLAAQQVRDDPADVRHGVLRQAAHQFPENPRLLYSAVTLDLFPEERRLWIERFKQADPDNALPHYLSVRASLKQGDWAHAFEELEAAGQRAILNDYAVERIQAVEEIYLLQGRSPAEAKAVATSGCILPHLALLKDLANELAALQAHYAQSSDGPSLEALARIGTRLGRELSSGSGAKFLIDQIVGLEIERIVTANLDPQGHYPWLGQTPAERQAELEVQKSAMKEQLDPSRGLMSSLSSETDVLAFFDRVKLYTESDALRWLEGRTGSAPLPLPNPQ